MIATVRHGRFALAPEREQQVRDKQAARDWQVLQEWNAAEGDRLAERAMKLREQADKHETLAREVKASGDKATHNLIMLMVQNMRLQALAAERYTDWKLGQRRRRQLTQFAIRGGEATKQATTIYTDEQRARWRELRASDYARHSQRQAASFIVAREKLPAQAFETVRKALRKENG